MLADNVSSGIRAGLRLQLRPPCPAAGRVKREESVDDYAYRVWRELKGSEPPPPDVFVDAQTLHAGRSPGDAGAAQEHVDSSISKTINLPRDISFEAFKGVYEEAYAQNCKGCTTYRPNDVTGRGAGGEAAEDRKPVAAVAPSRDSDIVYIAPPLDRPEELPARTYKIKWPGSDHAIYITVNDVVQGGGAGPSRSSSTPRTWSTMPGRWR